MKRLTLFFVLVMVVGLFTTGCSNPEPSSATDQEAVKNASKEAVKTAGPEGAAKPGIAPPPP